MIITPSRISGLTTSPRAQTSRVIQPPPRLRPLPLPLPSHIPHALHNASPPFPLIVPLHSHARHLRSRICSLRHSRIHPRSPHSTAAHRLQHEAQPQACRRAPLRTPMIPASSAATP
ncbi:hypothetical protein K438DRAFT_2000451 [Mycena galopus ATCC 62051]|nr:hypothetical protein K438DRAFT_2000451 [Mycena galopus ATCC 62051]